MTVVGSIHVLADIWLLQHFGGVDERAYFRVAQQFTIASLLATSAALRVFWKEAAEYRFRGDVQSLVKLYSGVRHKVFFVSASVACAMIPFSFEIVQRVLGSQYEAAWPTLALMLFFSIHQSLGQIQGVFAHATRDTAFYAKVTIALMLASLPTTYLILSPAIAGQLGVHLGASGLAIKMVLLQLVGVTVVGASIARRYGLKYDARYQISVVVGLVLLGWGAKLLAEQVYAVAGLGRGLFSTAPAALAFYALGLLAVVTLSPGAVGLSSADLAQLVAFGRKALRRAAS
jgi:O-antigen/teichoic acid export membrane protein